MSKPSSSVVVPRQPTRLALVVAIALVGVALACTQNLAQGAGASLETYATSGDLCTSGGWVMTTALCWVAAFAATIGLVSLRQPGPRQVSPMVLVCVLLVVSIVTGTIALVAIASPILIVPGPDLPGVFSASVRFE